MRNMCLLASWSTMLSSSGQRRGTSRQTVCEHDGKPTSNRNRRVVFLLAFGLFAILYSATAVFAQQQTNYVTKFGIPPALVDSLIFDNGTDVGIGTATPRSFVEASQSVSGGTGAILTLTNSTTNGIGGSTAVDFNVFNPVSNDGRPYNATARILAFSDDYSADLQFLSNKPGNFNDGLQTNMVIQANGDVGIGTTTPAGALHVNGPASTPASGLSSGNNGLVLGTAGTSSYKWIQGYGGSLALNPEGNNVGIGTSTPAATLDVAGSEHISGNLNVVGAITAGTKDFKIDHPLDPANKYLSHASVESSEMMNIYTGNTILDPTGQATVQLPDWFEALNGDFRYELTSLGRPQPNLYIAREIADHRFKIAGGKPGGRVSWQVTGVRHDAYAKAYPVSVEENKPLQEQGHYLYPKLFGASEEQAVGYHAPSFNTTAAAQSTSLPAGSR